MTNQEAADVIKDKMAIHAKTFGRMLDPLKTAYEMAIEALEKREPKEPTVADGKNADRYYCPSCGMYYGQKGKHSVALFDKPSWCPECGQAIYWKWEADDEG